MELALEPVASSSTPDIGTEAVCDVFKKLRLPKKSKTASEWGKTEVAELIITWKDYNMQVPGRQWEVTQGLSKDNMAITTMQNRVPKAFKWLQAQFPKLHSDLELLFHAEIPAPGTITPPQVWSDSKQSVVTCIQNGWAYGRSEYKAALQAAAQEFTSKLKHAVNPQLPVKPAKAYWIDSREPSGVFRKPTNDKLAVSVNMIEKYVNLGITV